MKRLTQKRKMFLMVLFVLITTLIAGPVSAGGWAEITMNDMPTEIHAGESVQLDFMVYQHGKTPVHFLGESDIAVVPVVTGSNVETGETIEFTAVPAKGEVGRFYATVTFPTEGEWSWQITPAPLVVATDFEALTILPELSAPVTEVKADSNIEATTAMVTTPATATGWSAAAPWAGGLLIIVGVALLGFAFSRRNRQVPVAVDSGD